MTVTGRTIDWGMMGREATRRTYGPDSGHWWQVVAPKGTEYRPAKTREDAIYGGDSWHLRLDSALFRAKSWRAMRARGWRVRRVRVVPVNNAVRGAKRTLNGLVGGEAKP